MKRGIILRFDPPCTRKRDWFAMQTGFNPAIDPIGYGSTPDEALHHLKTKLEERDNARN